MTPGVSDQAVSAMREAQHGKCACGDTIAIVAYLSVVRGRLQKLECSDCNARRLYPPKQSP